MARNAEAPSVGAASVKRASENGFGRDHVGEIQRARVITAMAEVVCERGAHDASVAHVVERAGVSRRTFYELFEDREDCFLATLRDAIGRAERCVSDAYEPRARWAERIRSALEAALWFAEDEPVPARIVVVESLGGGAKALELRSSVLARIVGSVDAGRKNAVAGSSATVLTAEGVIGGVFSVVHSRLASEGPGDLTELLNPLMSMIVLPYLGLAAARRELERPVAKSSVCPSAAMSNPLKELDMRLTYRTVRVLRAVADNPGSSNRMIGEAAGVGDQGQISKLLGRLTRLGLLENSRTDPSKGAPNAWILTKRGEGIADVITPGTRRC